MVLDAVRGYLQLAGGVTELSRQRATAAAKAMLSSSLAPSEVTKEQVASAAESLVATSRTNRDAIVTLIRAEIDRGLGRMGLSTSDEVAGLAERVRSLESTIREMQGTAGGKKTAAAKKTAAGLGKTAAGKKTAASPRKTTAGTAAEKTTPTKRPSS